MKNALAILIVSGILVFFGSGTAVLAQNSKPVYTLERTISLPGNGGYDYLYVDPVTRHLFVTHGSTVNVINLKSGKFIGSVTGLGEDHGVAIDNSLNRGFVSDSRQRALVAFNSQTLKTIKTIHLKGEDEDATILDPASGKVFVFEGDSKQAEVVDPKTLKEVDIIPLGAKPEFAVSDGHGHIYNNLESSSQIAVIDVHSMKVVKKYSLGPCHGPSALALDNTHHRLFTGCRANKGLTVVNADNGDVIQTLPIGAGVDADRYDPETHLIFVSCFDGTTTIIKEESPDKYKVVQVLKTHMGARTMALDPQTHNIYLSSADFEKTNTGYHHRMVPDSYKVLVYKLNNN
ncbi:MAG TPA: hypothetical protein VKA08_16950 [Balneolales bacterium]|nr:hypothetical protein [Balneolales bacterium]